MWTAYPYHDIIWFMLIYVSTSQELTHWGWAMHICFSRLTIIGSNIGLLSGQCQAIIWNNNGLLLIVTLGSNFNEILIEMYIFSLWKMHLNISSVKWWPFCLSLNVLNVCFYGWPISRYRAQQLNNKGQWDALSEPRLYLYSNTSSWN